MKKGFTLIELLAVIVILAIIALIATPIVLNIINDTKESSQLRSAEFYLDAVETAVAQSTLNDKKLENKTYNILKNGNLCIEYKDNECINELEVKVSGEVPKGGIIILEQGKISDVVLELVEKTLIKDGENLLQPGLYDKNDNLIVTWDELVNDYGFDVEKSYDGNSTSRPGVIISTNEKLNKGVKLVVDSSVTRIGKNAFVDCMTLIEVVITPNIKTIDMQAFYNAKNLKKINIPKGVISLGQNAFRNCINLEKITLPDSLTTISNAFENCQSLTEIVIPNSITTLGMYAFKSCHNLKKIIIPDSVTTIGAYAFIY